jgi:hypothetical protein
MTTSEPLLPHPGDGDQNQDERVAAADPGRGAPEPAPGLGVGGEEPDVPEDAGDDRAARPSGDTPFRTPEPPQG